VTYRAAPFSPIRFHFEYRCAQDGAVRTRKFNLGHDRDVHFVVRRQSAAATALSYPRYALHFSKAVSFATAFGRADASKCSADLQSAVSRIYNLRRVNTATVRNKETPAECNSGDTAD
jgi:hypothetical protein